MKRFLSILLSIVMVFSCFGICASAATTTSTWSDVKSGTSTFWEPIFKFGNDLRTAFHINKIRTTYMDVDFKNTTIEAGEFITFELCNSEEKKQQFRQRCSCIY